MTIVNSDSVNINKKKIWKPKEYCSTERDAQHENCIVTCLSRKEITVRY